MEVTGAIYGLSQSGYLANQDLVKNLAIYGYHPVIKREPQDYGNMKLEEPHSHW
jgi:hypothetical protein